METVSFRHTNTFSKYSDVDETNLIQHGGGLHAVLSNPTFHHNQTPPTIYIPNNLSF